MRRSWWIGCFVACCVITAYLFLRAHTYLCELVHDDGLFLYTGQAWASGELAYRDFWDHKPPGLFFFLSIPLMLFPFSLVAVKTFCTLWMALTAILLIAWLVRISGWIPALLAGAAFVLFTSVPFTIQSGGLTEEPALLFVLLGIIAFSIPSQRVSPWVWWLLAGIAFGVAIQFRQTFVFSAWVAYLWLIQDVCRHPSSWGKPIGFGALFSLGMVVPELFWQGYFFVHGAWWDYVEGSYLFNVAYVESGGSQMSWIEGATFQYTVIQRSGPLFLGAPLAMITRAWLSDEERRWVVPLQVAWIGELIAIGLSGEFYSHYYVQSGIVSGILLGLAIKGAMNAGQSAWQKRDMWTMVKTIPVTGITILFLAYPSWTAAVQYQRDMRACMNNRESETSGYALQQDVARVSAMLTDPDDRILLIGREPNSVYFLAGRYAGSRFYHFAPIWKDKLSNAVTENHQQAFLDDLQTRKPQLLLLDLTRLDSADPLDRVRTHTPNALAWIEENTVPLEDVLGDAVYDWFWYDIRLVMRVHTDSLDAVRERFNTAN